MRFLADESCDFSVVTELRFAGHDVACVAETNRSLPDAAVLEWAVRDARVLLTEDRDFGQLAYAGAPHTGVVFLRFPATARPHLLQAVSWLVATHGASLPGSFTVLQPERVRIRRASEQ